LSSVGLSFGTLLPGRATNAYVVGASADDVSALSTMGRVVHTMVSAADALPLRMVGILGHDLRKSLTYPSSRYGKTFKIIF
jgi:hypothetical protein